MSSNTIIKLVANPSDLHLPEIYLEDGRRFFVRAMSLAKVYGRKGIDLDVIDKEWCPTAIFVYEQGCARKELIPILIKALKEDKKYAKLSLINKGYYNTCKKYNLLKELKLAVKE